MNLRRDVHGILYSRPTQAKVHSMKMWFRLSLAWIGCWFVGSAWSQTNEFRGLWCPAFNPGFKSSSEVSQFVADARVANFNAIIPQIRKRGDCYYNASAYEPKASDISPSTFDPLAEMITQSHDTSNGKQRLEVHGWICTFPIWASTNAGPPSQANHAYNLHPEWLTRDVNGQVDDGFNYCLDPGHPGAAEWTCQVALDIISRYDLDGLNFDYVRYSGRTWGYNPTSVARFNARFNRTGNPTTGNAAWLQWRREQVSAVVRKIYLEAIALKPWIKMSADTITWGSGPASEAAWYSSSAAWTDVLQDWRGWMAEGILDYNFPMAYYAQSTSPTAYAAWANFAKDHQYNRHAAILMGGWLNNASNCIVQLRACRDASTMGNSCFGGGNYAYNGMVSGMSRSTFLTTLTTPSAHDPITPPIYSDRAAPTPMPWKLSPAKGHLKGYVYLGGAGNPVDGAVVTLSGPINRTLTNDSSGFYGAVDLPFGTYTLTASFPGLKSATNVVEVSPAVFSLVTNGPAVYTNGVVTRDLLLDGAPLITAHPQSQALVENDPLLLTVSASGSLPLSYQWRQAGVPVPTATNTSFVFEAIQTNDAGNYDVMISNSFGAVTSLTAVVTVQPAPPIWFPSVSRLATNGFVQMNFSGRPGRSYLIEASTDLEEWLPATTTAFNQNTLWFGDPDSLHTPWRFYRGREISTVLITDMEAFNPGAPVLVNRPNFSGSTSSYLDTAPASLAYVTNSFPGDHAGGRVLAISWSFKAGTSNPWVRLTTSDGTYGQAFPNTTIDFREGLQFDIYTDRNVYLALGLRETSTTALIGGNGGRTNSSGVGYPIEWVGGITDNSSSPPKGRFITAGQWQTVRFFFPYEPVANFAGGNGVLQSTTGKGVLENIAIVPASGTGVYNLYIDNLQVIYLTP